ncbi:hypothetical protein C5B85_12135 [Pseudoclavibacter sp. AY1F1]|uniref:LpqN/LpqT family lipoprotein n=1 Tax=Pseudoclavibacter sp. AY1F1 TaxID=2080583 RepID=UPI000CE7720F|nr:LpqN/LpqT family lipoprotein [Pseudoclavibacter sp. AY1F1]PPF43890.1 hypothetical protein C5B85_12135 [Pseudoclavibacter sp. AY1F1]
MSPEQLRRLSMPSEDFPAFPRVSIDVPAGWEPLQWAGSVLGARHLVATNGFNPNVLVTIERWPGTISHDDALTVLRQRITQGGGKERLAETETETEAEGQPSHYVESTQRDPRLGGLEVRSKMIVLHRGPVTEIVTAVGTSTAAQSAHIGKDIAVIVRGLQVEVVS